MCLKEPKFRSCLEKINCSVFVLQMKANSLMCTIKISVIKEHQQIMSVDFIQLEMDSIYCVMCERRYQFKMSPTKIQYLHSEVMKGIHPRYIKITWKFISFDNFTQICYNYWHLNTFESPVSIFKTHTKTNTRQWKWRHGILTEFTSGAIQISLFCILLGIG